MNNLINIKTENFKRNLLQLINSSELPISNIYYVFQLIENQIEKTYYKTINFELADQQKKEEDTEEEKKQQQ